MIGFLRRNAGYKLFALMLSVMLYYVASGQQNPVGTRDQYVQPEVIKLPNNLVVKESPALVAVKVTGAQSVLAALDKKPLKATVDGSLVKPGANRLTVSLALPPGITLVGTPLPLAEFAAERKEAIPYAVDVDFAGTAPPGQEYGDGVPTPGNVILQGVADDLKRVGRVVAGVERKPDELSIERDVVLYAEDSGHRRVEGVEIVPERVHVRVDLRPVPITKSMVLSAEAIGVPAPGYRVLGYEVEPSQIVVRGAYSALSTRSSVPVTVDVSGATATVVKTVTLTLPPGMSPQVSLPPIRVRVLVAPINPARGAASLPSPAASSAAIKRELPAPVP